MDGAVLSGVLVWGFSFIFSTTFHEAAHAWAAKKGGDLTAYHGGLVTFNPIPHIIRSPFGMVVVPILAFVFSGFMIGWASTPYNRLWAERYPHRSAWMSLAGPAANLAIFLAALAALKLGMALQIFPEDKLLLWEMTSPENLWHVLGHLLFILYTLNVILFCFNLFPLPPLDGSEVILLFFPEHKAPAIRQNMQMFGMFGIFLAILVFNSVGAKIIGAFWLLV